MDIRKLSDKELVKEIAGRCVTDSAAVDLAKFIRQCVKDSQKELVEALEMMLMQYGGMVDGGVEEEARIAVEKAEHALREAMEEG